jgi:hypothetical protein
MRLSLGILCIAVSTAGACSGDPPDKEIQQAQSAIEAARAGGAERYATSELTAAQQTLAHAREAVGERDYRLALSYALDARERAQTATKEAMDRKVALRDEAERNLGSAQTALAAARNRLKTAEASKIPARALAEARSNVATGEGRVQEARTAFEQGNFEAAGTAASQAANSLAQTARDLDALIAPPGRRRG